VIIDVGVCPAVRVSIGQVKPPAHTMRIGNTTLVSAEAISYTHNMHSVICSPVSAWYATYHKLDMAKQKYDKIVKSVPARELRFSYGLYGLDDATSKWYVNGVYDADDTHLWNINRAFTLSNGILVAGSV